MLEEDLLNLVQLWLHSILTDLKVSQHFQMLARIKNSHTTVYLNYTDLTMNDVIVSDF